MMRFFVSPTAEPLELHNSDEPGTYFAVHLAPDTRPLDSTSDARSFLEWFLATDRDVRFYCVEYIDNGTFSEPQRVDWQAEVPTDDRLDLMPWLHERTPVDDPKTPEDRAKNDRYWRGPIDIGPGDGSKDDVITLTDNSIVAAMDLLRGSLNWPAPLPHRAGLVHLVRHTTTSAGGKHHVIFPWWKADDPPALAIQATWYGAASGSDDMPFPIEEKDKEKAILLHVGNYKFITRLLRPFPKIEGYRNDGWIEAGWANSKTVRQLRRARIAFNGSLSPLPAISDLAFVPDPTTGGPTELENNFAKWLDQQGAKMLLDPFDVAVFGTNLKKQPLRGRLWDTLIEVYEDVAEKLKAKLMAPADWPLDKSKFDVDALKRLIDLPEDTETVAKDKEPPDNQVNLPKVLAELNELAAELADPDVLLNVTMAYLKACLGGWSSTLANTDGVAVNTFANNVEAAFRAYYTGPGADLATDLREDSADFLMSRLQELVDTQQVPDDPEDQDWKIRQAIGDHYWLKRRLRPDFSLNSARVDKDKYASLRPLEATPPELNDLLYKETGEPLGIIFRAQQLAMKEILQEEFVADLEPQPLQIVAAQGFDVDDLDDIGEHTTGIGLIIAARHAMDTDPDSNKNFLNTAAHANAASILPWPHENPKKNITLDHPVIEPSTLTQNFGQIEISIPFNGIPQIGRMVASPSKDSPTMGLNVPLPYELDHADYDHSTKNPKLRPLVPLAYGYEYAAMPFYVSNYGMLPECVTKKNSTLLERMLPVTPWEDSEKKIPWDPAPDLYLRTTAVAAVPISNHHKSKHRGLGYVPEDVFPIAPDLLDAAGLLTKDVKPNDIPILLLGHETKEESKQKKGIWLPGLGADAVLAFTAPRVGYEDFDRWMTNKKLRDEVGKASGLDKEGKTIGKIVDAVVDARDFLEDLGDTTLAEIVNRLPDPAVSKLEVRVQVFDSLLDAVPKDFDHKEIIDIAPYANLSPPDPDNVKTTYLDYEKFIEAINKNLQYKLTLKSVQSPKQRKFSKKDSDSKTELTLHLRDGDMCLVTVSPLVEKVHYQSDSVGIDKKLIAIHEGLKPETEHGKFCRLPGTSVLVEAMKLPPEGPLVPLDMPHDDSARAALNALQVQSEGRDRGFSYVLCPHFSYEKNPPGKTQSIYRAFGEVDLITHRWRSLGQPILNQIAPATFKTDKNRDSPIRELPNSLPVKKFEGDAFYGRQLFDGERRRIRLPTFLPVNSDNPDDANKINSVTLDQVNWPDQSACYWRYTLQFRSRYLGALKSRDAVVPIIGEAADKTKSSTSKGEEKARQGQIADLFVNRIAILADISGSTLAAPQLRHILPSLIATETNNGSLPFVASLNERPFDQFGLADRLVAGVTTTQKFALSSESESTDRVLEFTDYRKEVGPEPRRSHEAIGQDDSRRVILRTEGPVGHHFDPASADAPGFVNTSYLLHLDGIGPGWNAKTTQMFAAIELRRFVDPGWSFVPGKDDNTPSPATWWLDLDDDRISDKTGLVLEHLEPKKAMRAQSATGNEATDKQFSAVICKTDGDELVVKVNKGAAYGDEIHETNSAELCRVNLGREKAFLVHRSLGDDGYEVIILRQGYSESGADNALSAAQFVAAASYRAGALKDVRIGATSVLGSIAPMLMSNTPAVIWSKSAYDMSRFCVGDKIATLDGIVARLVNVEDNDIGLHFEKTSGKQRQRRLTSRDAKVSTPLGVHTHLAALMLRRSKNEGRTVLLPQETVLLDPVGRGKLPEASNSGMASLLAFESPAEIIQIPAQTGTGEATFDLDALPEGRGSHSYILLRCRIASLEAAAGQTLTLNIFQEGGIHGDKAKTKIEIGEIHLAKISYVDIHMPRTGAPLTAKVTVYTHHFKGEAINLDIEPITPDLSQPGTLLKLSAEGVSKAVLDISMIPAVPEKHNAWNWDWVFPPVATDESTDNEGNAPPPNMESATSVESLRLQKEAVVTPLGMTEPITLIRDR